MATMSAAGGRALPALTLGLVALLALVLRPVLGPIALGGFAAIVAHGPMERLVARLSGRRTLAGALVTAAVALALLLPSTLLLIYAAGEAAEALQALSQGGDAARTYAAIAERLPSAVREALPGLLEAARGSLLDAAAAVPLHVPGTLASSGRFLVSAVLTAVVMFALLRDGPALVDFVRRASPLREPETVVLLTEFREVALGLFRGGVVVGLFHGGSAAVGLLLFGVPQVLLLAVLCAVASFVPVVGTGLVSVPLAVGLAATGQLGKALGVLIWFAVVVGAGDHLLRPFVSKGRMALQRPLLFLTIFGGLQLMGPLGLLLGPLVGSLAVAALRLAVARGDD
jgi:predicted PurR-regulated permease PerM